MNMIERGSMCFHENSRFENIFISLLSYKIRARTIICST